MDIVAHWQETRHERGKFRLASRAHPGPIHSFKNESRHWLRRRRVHQTLIFTVHVVHPPPGFMVSRARSEELLDVDQMKASRRPGALTVRHTMMGNANCTRIDRWDCGIGWEEEMTEQSKGM